MDTKNTFTIKFEIFFHRRCRCPKLLTVLSSSPEPLVKFHLDFATKHPYVLRIQVCSNKGPSIFTREDNIENILKPFKQFLHPNLVANVLG